jgi:hydrocephalus-inducing protein
MMFPGKRIEMLFEYLPEDTHVAEAFFMFKLPKVGLSQLFLFAGKVNEPKISFSSAKLDFHAVMLGGEGITETVYLENQEHMPFHFAFDKYSLMQLDGPEGPVLTITPSEGSVPPNGKLPITFYFIPQEEVIYNYNVICNVKRKPNKLAINVKGEGYAVHPQIQLENTMVTPAATTTTAAAAAPAAPDSKSATKGGKTTGAAAATAAVAPPSAPVVLEKFLTLKPLPATNVADFGSVQVLDSLSKSITVLNAGKYNFDYSWNIDHLGNMLHLSGGKLNGTLLKGEELTYKLTFAPQSEGNLDKCGLRFTVAGKYVYQLIPRGVAVKPALRFSWMHHDFGPCFITSPGGTPVIEEKLLLVKNHDPASNISVECIFQKIRALAVECPPSVIPPGGELAIPIRFAPREMKEYSFVVPFMVNGSSRVQVNITGQGIAARLELVNGSQRRTAFGLVNVGTTAQRTVLVVNKSKRALPLTLLQAGAEACNLSDRCIAFAPTQEIRLAPRETYPLTLTFAPTKRVPNFQEDLLVQYAGITRTLVTIAGKAQGIECALDTDSIPFGLVVLDSQKVKKATLENTGDLTITYQWQANTFGPHFHITPLAGKILPGNEQVFEVTFKPQFVDEDIRQDHMTLVVPGREPMSITCSGVCIAPPTENIKTLTFQSHARKNDVKTVKITNTSDRDWFVSPSLQGVDWKVPYEFKVPAKGSADLPVTYYPLTMTSGETKHSGRLFIALPDGSAELYDLVGTALAPESSGRIDVETPAKKAATVTLKVVNWLSEIQKLDVTMEILSKPSPATFVIAANATEVGPNGTKEFPVRFISYAEGNSQARITFTNPVTGEYCFYDVFAKTTMSEVLETFALEAPVRQTARAVITIENPLAMEHAITMGSVGKPHDPWWSCDNTRAIKVNELIPIAGNREGSFEIEYRPLTITDRPQEHLVTITTQELGVFKYKIVVRASPPLLKQVLRFDAALGTMQTEYFVFRSYHASAPSPQAYAFACAVSSNPDCFSVPKTFPIEAATLAAPGSVAAWEGEEMRLPIQFEPVSIGDFRDVVTIKGTDGAEYTCELIGHCTPPLPQGPVTIDNAGPATGTEITFRNCFTQSCQWSFATDSPLFRVVTPANNAPLSVNAKSEAKCMVVFEPRDEADLNVPGGVIPGKLFVTCTSKPEVPAWVYYLRGKVSVKTAAPAPAAGKKK